MSHYAVNTGVPKTLIQHLIRWVISHDLFDDAVDQVLQRDPRAEDHPGAGARRSTTRSSRTPRRRSAPTRCRTSRSTSRCATASGPAKIAFLAQHAWADRDAGAWPPGFPQERRVDYDLAEIRRWLEVFVKRFFGFAQFKRSALPNGPKVSPAGRCRRAATGARPPTATPRSGWPTSSASPRPDPARLA